MSEFETLKNLKKSNTDCKIAGICGGLGEYTPLPSWCWRAIFLFSLCLGGLGFIAYLVLWVCMPNANAQPNRRRNQTIQHEI